MPDEILSRYNIVADNVPGYVSILRKPIEYIPIYEVKFLHVTSATDAILTAIKEKIIEKVKVKLSEIVDPKAYAEIKARFMAGAQEVILAELPKISSEERQALAGYLVHEMLGLGKLEVLLNDDALEEIVVNNSSEPLYVYHKKFGWLKTNINISTEEQIYNYSSIIGRKVGRQITNLNPLMDAHLPTGDRVNATLFPISTKGNTITIRKFRREPWTIIHLIEDKTLNTEIAALLWLSIQYELNIIVAGGTASGKTTLLNSLMPFVPTNHRVISIEDTRELMLPQFLHWIPLTTREPNPEGRGEITMLDLLVNSLRMRPDRVVLGEIRRQREAEVLFEAMHTGHSVYSTFHADRADQVLRRLTNPPISLPESLLESLHMVIVQFRHRKLGIRRTFQLGEIVVDGGSGRNTEIGLNILYQWNPKNDSIEKIHESKRLMEELKLHTGMSIEEVKKDLLEKQEIFKWMSENKIKTVNAVGKVIADYYVNRQKVLDVVGKKGKPEEILGAELAKEISKGAA